MKVIWYVEMGPKCGDDVVVHVGEVEIVVGRVNVFGDSWDVWSWSGAVGEVIEVVEDGVVESLGEDGHVEIEGSEIVEVWIEVYPSAMAMQKELELVVLM